MAGHDIIVIGASAGGVEALKELVSRLPADLPAVVFIVLHVSPHGTSVLPQILSRAGRLPAQHATDGQVFSTANIYIAPPNHHLLIKSGYIKLTQGPKENGHRPAVDVLFRTASRAYGPRVIGVVLSGVLDDGSAGLISIKRYSGLAVVQDPADAMYPGMPQSAIEADDPDYIVPVSEMAALLIELARIEVPEMTVRTPEMADEPDVGEIGPGEHDMTKPAEPGGLPTTYVCPDCGGVLMEYHEGNLFRFRCQVGHAYSAETLISEQGEALEGALWMALRALKENLKLTRRLADRAAANGHDKSRDNYLERAAEIELHADTIHQLLLNGDGRPEIKSKV